MFFATIYVTTESLSKQHLKCIECIPAQSPKYKVYKFHQFIDNFFIAYLCNINFACLKIFLKIECVSQKADKAIIIEKLLPHFSR